MRSDKRDAASILSECSMLLEEPLHLGPDWRIRELRSIVAARLVHVGDEEAEPLRWVLEEIDKILDAPGKEET